MAKGSKKRSAAMKRFWRARKRAGKRTKTGMSEDQLDEFASTKRKGLPARAKGRRGMGKVRSY